MTHARHWTIREIKLLQTYPLSNGNSGWRTDSDWHSCFSCDRIFSCSHRNSKSADSNFFLLQNSEKRVAVQSTVWYSILHQLGNESSCTVHSIRFWWFDIDQRILSRCCSVSRILWQNKNTHRQCFKFGFSLYLSILVKDMVFSFFLLSMRGRGQRHRGQADWLMLTSEDSHVFDQNVLGQEHER